MRGEPVEENGKGCQHLQRVMLEIMPRIEERNGRLYSFPRFMTICVFCGYHDGVHEYQREPLRDKAFTPGHSHLLPEMD
jgi:hypothetical protein